MPRSIHITVAVALATAAFSATAAAQQPSRENVEAVRQAFTTNQPVVQDLRSPDAQDASRNPVATYEPAAQDLRSPDAQDAVRNQVATYQPGQLPTSVGQVRAVPSSGFDWGDAGIGAAGMLALVALGIGSLLTVEHRRRSRMASS